MFTHNFFAYETEVNHRHREYQRQAEAEALAAQARPAHVVVRWPHWRSLVVTWLRPPAAPRFATTAASFDHRYRLVGTLRTLAPRQVNCEATPLDTRIVPWLAAGSGLRSLL